MRFCIVQSRPIVGLILNNRLNMLWNDRNWNFDKISRCFCNMLGFLT